MKINGRAIAQTMYSDLRERTRLVKQKGITPHFALILIGDDPASESYVLQKKTWSEYIGAQFSLIHYPIDVSQEEVVHSIRHLNNDTHVHGIIVQRPLPPQINRRIIIDAINPEKDIDGFHPDSPYVVPVAAAVLHVLSLIYQDSMDIKPDLAAASVTLNTSEEFLQWLKKKSLIVIGKGETAGGPIIKLLKRQEIKPLIIDSNTKNPAETMKQADIIISAVGKPDIIKPAMVKKHVILLGVGMHKNTDGKLRGDYPAKILKNKADYYTAVTGGIGPVNVAFLLYNLIKSAESLT
jgi:methylenetetrahydrofolate dehydrogenase (NADP+) / methenyltetrahydrofolate cyclohydrolase